AVILDHSGAVYRHGLPEDHVDWTLGVDKRAINSAQQKRERGEAPKLRECPSCKAVMVSPPCCACGWQPQPRARGIDFEDCELGLVERGRGKASAYGDPDRRDFFQQLGAVAQMRGYKNGWAAHKYKDKFGTFPPWAYNDLQPIAPTDALLRWVRS